jgi:hypothetical protein
VVSLRLYTPALTARSVTELEPLVPEIVTGPAAVSGKFADVAVPPLSFVTVLTSVRRPGCHCC